MVNRTNCCRPAMLLLLALAWTAGGCATYRPIAIGKQPDSDAGGSGQLPPFAGEAIRSLEMVQRPLATSSFGGALGTVALIGVIAGTILLVLDPPFGDS